MGYARERVIGADWIDQLPIFLKLVEINIYVAMNEYNQAALQSNLEALGYVTHGHISEMDGRWIGRLEQLGAPLWNPPALLRWNLDKRYLLDLAARGVPVVPTIYLAAGSRV